MSASHRIRNLAIGLAALPLLAVAWSMDSAPVKAEASAPQAQVGVEDGLRIVAMRRITEAQYRNAIADIFGPDIKVAGRFEPIVRPAHELIASGASDAAISPSGFEQFDAIARVVSAQVFDETHRGQF